MALERVSGVPIAPSRPDDAHKGTFGTAFVVGGSRGMSGAPSLAGVAALRGGAGLVRVAVPESLQPIVAAYEPSHLTLGLPEDDSGRIAGDALATLQSHAARSQSFAIGPGLGQSDGLRRMVVTLFTTLSQPAVFDADALNALAASSNHWRVPSNRASAPRILTPHPGEFSRLTGARVGAAAADREAAAVDFARECGVVLILKGHRSVITDGERIAVNPTGNNGMATGGTGDVLTGLVTALLAQRMPAFEAARLGAYLHGLAGDLAAAELSEPALIASDLLAFLGKAWRRLAESSG